MKTRRVYNDQVYFGINSIAKIENSLLVAILYTNSCSKVHFLREALLDHEEHSGNPFVVSVSDFPYNLKCVSGNVPDEYWDGDKSEFKSAIFGYVAVNYRHEYDQWSEYQRLCTILHYFSKKAFEDERRFKRRKRLQSWATLKQKALKILNS